MKKILLLSMVACAVSITKAQTTLFNQTFATGAANTAEVATAYIRNNSSPQIAIGDNMFTKLGPFNSNSVATNVSVTGGSLKLQRTGAFASLSSSDYMLTAARTVSGASNNTNARLVLNSPQVLKLSMDVTISDFLAYSSTFNELGNAANVNGMANTVLLFVGGDALNQNGSDNPNGSSANAHSALAITTSVDGNTFRFSRPSGFGNSGNGDDVNLVASYANGTTVSIAWYVNNSGNAMTYTGPDGTAQTLGNDQWDLFVKSGSNPYIRVLDDRAALTSGVGSSINNMALQVRPQNGYTANTPNASTWVPNPITVEIANWKVEDVTSLVTLPVKLDRFSGVATTIGNELSWRTGSETNNSHFELLRAKDGINFAKIGEVAGKGNTSGFTNYTFIDRSPIKGVNYYMLKQVDFDGKTDDYSPIAVRALDRDAQFTILSKENGEVEVLYFAENADKNTSLKIFDLNGRMLVNQILRVEKGYNKVAMSATLPNGLLVGTITSSQQSSSIKFLK